jgi:hypothetical protein
LTAPGGRPYGEAMARARWFVVALVGTVAVSPALAATKLKIASRPNRDSAKVTYASTDAIGGLDKGAGTDPGAISAIVYVKHDGVTTRWVLPEGAYAGRAGWLANDASRALYANRDAPGGPTETSRSTFATGRRVKFLTKGLGDVNPLALSGVPGTDVEVAYVVTNGGETHTHCTKFHATSCTYAPVDGGTGYKLKCSGGVADLQCGAKPTCGNGIRESGEHCDGGVGCTANCLQALFSCCQGANQCYAAPIFSLQFYLLQYCSVQEFGSQPWAGQMCRPDGTCGDAAIDPVPVCCQQETSCYDGTASSIVQLWFANYNCLNGTGLGGPRHIVINGTCGGDGLCVAN